MLPLPRRALTVTTLLLLLLAASPDMPLRLSNPLASAQTAPRAGARAPTGTITGRVTSGTDGLGGVLIELLASQSAFGPPRTAAIARTRTEDDGSFRLTNIAAGRYFIRAFTPHYVLPGDNPARATPKSVILDEGDTVEGINFSMTRGAVITGRVTDGEGRPVIAEGVKLELLEEPGKQQHPSYYYYFNDRFSTDDRGVYRIYGLPAGRYRVSVGSSRGDGDGRAAARGRRPYVRTYHPNATEISEAKIVELSAGAEATGINITVGSLSEAFKASGRIVDAESGQPLANARFSYGVTDNQQRYISGFGPGDRANQRGEFFIENLAPGHYAAFLIPESGSESYAEPAIFEVVDSDVTGIEIKVRRGASLSGVVVIEGTADRSVRDRLRRLQLFVNTERKGLEAPARPTPKISPDGSFHQSGLPPGRARINIWPPVSDGLSLLRVERDGVLLNNGIELAAGEQVTGLRVVLAYGTGVVRGRVLTQSGGIPEAVQMGVSIRRVDAEETQRAYPSPSVEVDERGRFLIDGLPSGEYEVTLRFARRTTPGRDRPVSAPGPARPLVQRVSVTSGSQTDVTFTLDASVEESEGER